MAKRLTKRVINKIHELRAAGLTGVAISKRLGKSRPTIYKVLHSSPSSNGATAPKKPAAPSNGSGLQAIEAIVRREVDMRLKAAKDAAVKALNESLTV